MALDLSDINKPYARAMEYLAGVWDGSASERGKGYCLAGLVGEDLAPLYGELYSHLSNKPITWKRSGFSPIRA